MDELLCSAWRDGRPARLLKETKQDCVLCVQPLYTKQDWTPSFWRERTWTLHFNLFELIHEDKDEGGVRGQLDVEGTKSFE